MVKQESQRRCAWRCRRRDRSRPRRSCRSRSGRPSCSCRRSGSARPRHPSADARGCAAARRARRPLAARGPCCGPSGRRPHRPPRSRPGRGSRCGSSARIARRARSRPRPGTGLASAAISVSARSKPSSLRAGVHRDAEAGAARLAAVDRDHERVLAPRAVVRIDVRALEEDPVLDRDSVQLARPHAHERELGRPAPLRSRARKPSPLRSARQSRASGRWRNRFQECGPTA